MIRDRGHGYILGVKGNAGKVHDVIADYNWDGIETMTKFINEGHGRQEMRTLKIVRVDQFQSDEFKKYRDVAVVFSVKADIRHVK
jgi:hypothetical protein